MAFTEADYQTLITTKNRIQAVKDAQIVINKNLSNLGVCITELQGYLTTMGSADSLISQDLIDEITTIGTLFNTGKNNISDNHKVFLTGDDGIE